MDYKGNYWLTNSQMVKYQSTLCENPCIQLEVVKTLNPATLLLVDSGPLEHDCLEVTDEAFSSLSDVTDQPVIWTMSISKMAVALFRTAHVLLDIQ
jgi:hypothetical protein